MQREAQDRLLTTHCSNFGLAKAHANFFLSCQVLSTSLSPLKIRVLIPHLDLIEFGLCSRKRVAVHPCCIKVAKMDLI